MQGHSYNAAERILHYLALGSKPIAEFTFDLNPLLSSDESKTAADERHVFVSGLARAGTTIVMRRLYETGMFRSLTYRDMPFVLCPNLWQRISAHARRDIAAVERAHGDRLLVDVDSPEALDEVFWRVFAGSDYIKPDHLRAHAADAELIAKFRRYVSSILSSGSNPHPAKRYLSKNNNNILRLGSLEAAFPRSIILIPFRDPLQHALSLLNQHVKFCKLQQENNFARSYMTWLAHHEFGREHKPFWFDSDSAFIRSAYSESSINYWLETWLRAYGRIQKSRPANSILVCYEDLCSNPAAWDAIRERVGVDSPPAASSAPFSRGEERKAPEANGQLVAQAGQLHGALRAEVMHSVA
jgi:Sulfotransferase family